MSQNKTVSQEIKALRRPFLRELFRENGFNLAMTLVSAALMAAGQLVISWLIKEIVDLISGISRFAFGTLLMIAGSGLLLMVLAAVIDYIFLSRFRALVREHLGDENLSVEQLGSDLGLSRVQLYRKVKVPSYKG